MMLPFLLSSICTCRFRIFQVYRRGVHWVIILFVEGGGIQGSLILVVLLCEFNKFKFNPLAWSTHESFVMNMWKDKLTGAFHNHIYVHTFMQYYYTLYFFCQCFFCLSFDNTQHGQILGIYWLWIIVTFIWMHSQIF